MVSVVFVWPQALEKPHTATALNCWLFFRKGVRQGGVWAGVGTVQGPAPGSSPFLRLCLPSEMP